MKWYKAEFEKLGWMVLAAERDKHDDLMKRKVALYKDVLLRLKDKLECKMITVEEKDRRNDLEIMLRDLNVLISFVNKHL